MLKKSNDLMQGTMMLCYSLLLFVTVIIFVVVLAAVQEQIDTECYNQDTTQEIK